MEHTKALENEGAVLLAQSDRRRSGISSTLRHILLWLV